MTESMTPTPTMWVLGVHFVAMRKPADLPAMSERAIEVLTRLDGGRL
jgi:hypothetical protein